MNIQELQAAIQSYHKPELANLPGMVWQIWEDGELTLQKSGPLFNQRNLHCIVSGSPDYFGLFYEIMPCKESKHSYAIIESQEVGLEIQKLMQKTYISLTPTVA